MIGGTDPGRPAMIHIYFSDPDEAFARALAAGAEVVQQMTEKGDGDRRGGVRTPCGTEWFLSRQVD